MQVSAKMEYQVEGIALDTRAHEMSVDLSQPRTLIIRGENPKTGITKNYILRVTHAGGLVLQ